MTEKEIISFRVPTSVSIYVRQKSKDLEMSYTELIMTLILIGLENSKDIEENLEKKRNLAIQNLKMIEADSELKIIMKRAFLVDNYRKLMSKVNISYMNTARKEEIRISLLNRIKLACGEDSEEYKGALKWTGKPDM
jgi:hypothetical protein